MGTLGRLCALNCMQGRSVTIAALYLFGTMVPIVIGGVGLNWMLYNVGREPGAAKSRLEERVQTAREIRAALAKPIPPPAPLPPITAKLAHPIETKPVARAETKTKRIPKEAWDAFAQERPDSEDRRAVTHSYVSNDRLGTGGW